MSFLTRLRRPRADNAGADNAPTDNAPTGKAPTDDVVGHRKKRPVIAWATAVLAFLLVLFALLAPNRLGNLTPLAFVRIPVEGLLGVALVLVLPARARPVVAVIAGLVLGVLTILKIVDMGFYEVLVRPFDPVLDWPLLGAAVEFVRLSYGRAGAIGAVLGVVLLVVAVLVLMALSVLRLTRLVESRRTTAIRTAAVLAVVWVACAALGLHLVPRTPIAAHSAATLTYDRALQVRAGLRDQQAFAAESAVDAFRDTPGNRLLTALRGKDVVISFIESYGRSAIEDPAYAPDVDAVLDAGTRRLAAAGYASRSGFLTSPTAGGGSWLAHSTLLSGLWIDNQQRYSNLVASDRLTLTRAFGQAGWRTVAVMPETTRAWPEGAFYGYDRVYTADNLGYHGPGFGFATMPDQYTLSAFERSEHATPGRPPLMAEIPLISSHIPWTPVPRLINWKDVGDGSAFDPMVTKAGAGNPMLRDPAQIRADYRRTIEYTLHSLISYLETYGNDNLVLVFLGDHQPAPIITGDDASRDVPITIVARDRAVLDRISGWGWDDGLKPGPHAPVWPMSAFRDRFLTAFS